jgi:hypothetical protein
MMLKSATPTKKLSTPTQFSRCGESYLLLAVSSLDSVLLEGVAQMEIPINPKNQARWDVIMNAPSQIEGERMPPKLVDAVDALWHDEGVQQAFARRNELQINDSAP